MARDRRAIAGLAIGQPREPFLLGPCARHQIVTQEVPIAHKGRHELRADHLAKRRILAIADALRPRVGALHRGPGGLRHRPGIDTFLELCIELIDRAADLLRRGDALTGQPEPEVRDRVVDQLAALPEPRDQVLGVLRDLHGVRFDEVRQLAEHAAPTAIDLPLVQLALLEPAIGGELLLEERVRDLVALVETIAIDLRELVEQRGALGIQLRDRGRVAGSELVVEAVIAERGRPGRGPPHHELPMRRDDALEGGIADPGDRIRGER